MKIELRKIHHSASLSEETNAYTADLYVDGELIAHVKNQGHGGCDMQHPAKGKTQADLDAVEAWIKANIPTPTTGMLAGFAPDLESLCGDLLTDFLIERDLKRLLNRTVAFVLAGTADVMSLKGKHQGAEATLAMLHIAKKHPGAKILNAMPFADAKALYKTSAEPVDASKAEFAAYGSPRNA